MFGGDELFASYPSFTGNPAKRPLAQEGFTGGETIGRDIRIVTAPIVKRFTSPKYAGIFEYGGTYCRRLPASARNVHALGVA